MTSRARGRGCAVAAAFAFGLFGQIVIFFIVWDWIFPRGRPLWTLTDRVHSFFIATGDRGLELQPGETVKLQPMAAGGFEWPGGPVVSAFNRWSVTPTDGVELNRWTGTLRVLPEAKHGSRHVIRGKLGFRGIPVEEKLIVYRRESNPLIGRWGSELRRDGTMWFRYDGSFAVAMSPRVESMVDYSGTYRFDAKTGTLELIASDAPADADLKGSFRIENGNRLILEDMYLGSFPSAHPAVPAATAETFRRFD
jgi:hypothetical protein